MNWNVPPECDRGEQDLPETLYWKCDTLPWSRWGHTNVDRWIYDQAYQIHFVHGPCLVVMVLLHPVCSDDSHRPSSMSGCRTLASGGWMGWNVGRCWTRWCVLFQRFVSWFNLRFVWIFDIDRAHGKYEQVSDFRSSIVNIQYVIYSTPAGG